jgi:hypothetical protein
MNYLEFLEEVVNELSRIVKGSVKLEVPVTSSELPGLGTAYIKVIFSKANIFVCFDCGTNSEAKKYYSLLCNHPKGAKSYIECCVDRLQACLEYEILRFFMED